MNTEWDDMIREMQTEKGKNYVVDTYQHVLEDMYKIAKNTSPKEGDRGAYLCAEKEVNGFSFYIQHKETGNTYELVYESWDVLLSLEVEPDTLETLTKESLVFLFLKHAFHQGVSPEKAEATRKGLVQGRTWVTTHKNMDLKVVWRKYLDGKWNMMRLAKENRDILSIYDTDKKAFLYPIAE